jgi:hypothetical protein
MLPLVSTRAADDVKPAVLDGNRRQMPIWDETGPF